MYVDVVYFLYDAEGQLIYVGCTSNFEQRIGLHRSATPWFHEVHSHKLRPYHDRRTTLRMEARFIRRLQPKYNVVHTERARGPRAVREYEGPVTTVGERLRMCRTRRGVSMATLADAVGATAGAVTHWETGRFTPRPAMQLKIAKALDVPHSFLFNMDEVA